MREEFSLAMSHTGQLSLKVGGSHVSGSGVRLLTDPALCQALDSLCTTNTNTY